MAPSVVYSVGKGGVGKTTCAAALALHTSHTCRTLVVSLDPAHNLGDVLEHPLGEKPKEVTSGLWASEVDMEGAVDRYLKASSEKLRQMYGYLKVINMEGYLDALRLSPGIEEYATLQAMEELLSTAEGSFDIVVFDTPPTGLTLRVLALPQVSLLWGERLARLRREILHKRGAIKNIHGERKFVLEGKEEILAADEKSDAVMRELRDYSTRMQRMTALQADAVHSRVMPVMNADRLSLFETKRALQSLSRLGMCIGPVIVNKVGVKSTDEQTVEEIARELERPVRKLPFMAIEPVGIEALQRIEAQLSFEQWVPETPAQTFGGENEQRLPSHPQRRKDA